MSALVVWPDSVQFTQVTPARRDAATLALVGAGAIGLVGHLINPYATTLPHCPFHALTGLWCPACGATRSLFSLMHGDIASAFRHNIFFLPATTLLLWEVMSYLVRAFFPALDEKWTRTPLQIRGNAMWTIPVVLCVFWVVRNIPGAPERLLSS